MSANHQKQSKALTLARRRKVEAWWRAGNYLSVDEIYLYDKPILKQPLTLAHIKPHRLVHCATRLFVTTSRATHRSSTLSDWFRNTS